MAERFAVIEFEEHPDEFRVRLGPVPLVDFEAVMDAYNAAARSGLMPKPMRAMAQRFAPFSESHDLEALVGLDLNLLMALVGQWINGVRSVPLPLPRRSSDGDTSEDPEIDPQN